MQRWLKCILLSGVILSSVGSSPVGTSASFPTSRPDAWHDGRHDFDFEFGKWRTRLTVRRPLSKTAPWSTYVGTSVVRPLWRGEANLGELVVAGRSAHIHALSLRLYRPASHQWAISFANSSDGFLSTPTIGHFENGRGDFFDREIFDGKPVRVHFQFSDITPRSFFFSQTYSSDGGRTWIPNWNATFVR